MEKTVIRLRQTPRADIPYRVSCLICAVNIIRGWVYDIGEGYICENCHQTIRDAPVKSVSDEQYR